MRYCMGILKGSCAVFAAAFLITGCHHDTRNYEVEVVNLTQNQPFSPLAVVLHDSGYAPWTIGSTASQGLELLSESGDNSQFLDEAAENLSREALINAHGRMSRVSGEGLILPGESEAVQTSVGGYEILLSLATMLVNTNDGYAGVEAFDISDLEVGEEMTRFLTMYDAGTEGNSELASSIPGPAAGGEGFNVARDDVNYVAHHPGVVSSVDGYTDSALDQSHRFDNPAALLVVRRIE
ncbi:MAG: hypothetical protein COB51_08990 [Moraxellaceae bacterium]|nr:MAG: hypothetical protein COB51_08990 [Moraxellaceae bacterium]